MALTIGNAEVERLAAPSIGVHLRASAANHVVSGHPQKLNRN
ncbi:MAG TPA: hypothetical protein VKX45_04935 [Bryobacteraceae bacterium]|nr:hypothetical protein [Bryobacteraceae bacterium]